MDSLTIKALSVNTRIGVYAWEQQISQQLLIDIDIITDFSACQDDLGQTTDYAMLCNKITDFVTSKSFQLIETVANEVAELIQKEFNVAQVSVGVSKPHAVKNAGNIQVTARRNITTCAD